MFSSTQITQLSIIKNSLKSADTMDILGKLTKYILKTVGNQLYFISLEQSMVGTFNNHNIHQFTFNTDHFKMHQVCLNQMMKTDCHFFFSLQVEVLIFGQGTKEVPAIVHQQIYFVERRNGPSISLIWESLTYQLSWIRLPK